MPDLSTLVEARAFIALHWLLVLTFLYLYRISGLFNLVHAHLILLPCYSAITWKATGSAIVNLALGFSLSILAAGLVELLLHCRLGEERSGPRGILLSLGLFYAAAAGLEIAGTPTETVVLPRTLTLGMPGAAPIRHWLIAGVVALIYLTWLLFLLGSRKGHSISGVMDNAPGAELLGIPTAKYRIVSAAVITLLGSLGFLALAGSGNGVKPDLGQPFAVMAIIIFLLSRPWHPFLGDLAALAVVLARWTLTSAPLPVRGFEDEAIILFALAILAIVQLPKPPGFIAAEDPEETFLAVGRKYYSRPSQD